MAKTAKIFGKVAGVGSPSAVPVGSGKYAIVNVHFTGNGCTLSIGGTAIALQNGGNSGTLNGIVVPASTNIQVASTASDSMIIASGFEYDN